MKNKTKIKKQFIFYVRRTIVSIWGSLLLGLAQFDTSNDYCGTQLSIFSLEVSHQSFLLTNALPLTTFYLECTWQFLSEIVPLTLITVQLIIVQHLLPTTRKKNHNISSGFLAKWLGGYFSGHKNHFRNSPYSIG